MKHEEIKSAEVVGFVGNGYLATGELCFQEIELRLNGKLYEIKQTVTKHPVMYLKELHFS